MLDPQGKVVKQTLKNMGYSEIQSIRQGKYFEIELNDNDPQKAQKKVATSRGRYRLHRRARQ